MPCGAPPACWRCSRRPWPRRSSTAGVRITPIVDYVLGLRSRMAEYMKKASKNLQASQELQKQWHDQKAVLIQYQPGQKVWVLEPVAPKALQDKWSGSHNIVEKKGEVTHLVDLGTARSPLRVLHVNRLKPYYDRADLTLLMATDEGQEEESDPLPDLFSSTEQDALVEGVVLADCLTAEQKDNCINLLDQFSELFSTVPGTTSWCEHTIDTGDSLPVKSKIYRQPDHVRDCIKQEVQKMLELGVVQHSESPWASPVVLVPKPHSKEVKREMRFCADYRGLNQEGDDINKWFAALERACVVQDVPQRQWAAILWLSFSGKGRDRLLTVKESDANNFTVVKNALLDGYGLTTEQYRIKFRETKKESSQDWIDFIDHSVKALEGWLHGSKVTDYDSLYNLILKEHILNNCVSDLLHQYLVDSDLTSPQELGKKADKWVRTRVNRKVHTGGDKDGNKKKDGKSSDKGGDISKNESSSGPQKHSGGGGGSKSSFNQNKEKKPWCYLCKVKGHWTTDPSCPKKITKPPTTTTPTATPSVPTNSSGGGSKPTNSQSKGVAGLTIGNLVGVGLVREATEAVLVSEGAIDLATLVACSLNMDKYKQLPLINGVEVQAYRDTGASVTMVIEKLVHPEQHLLCHQYQVTDAHNNTLSHPMAVVNLNWGGVTGPKIVVVATDLPVDCLLGNDLETSAWSDVELEAHAAMLGIPGHIFALTRAQAKKQKGQGSLDPGTMDQVLPKARTSRSKPLPTIPPSTVDSTYEKEEFPPCAEPTPEELEADTAELLGEGGPAR
ncbi:hypothetical protein NDU88_004184 [Pleurodeles waltl]|uniref:Uncharacterized protein n=1 Tax=Pleurodeles waltl TaxID=8319 RepID=A0AAV7TSS3_PLEWA|nr:hypothetical protein NDU88_004184 [Pleurodeles waltl]